MSGYERLKAAVIKDCADHDGCGCFNPDGCNVEGAKIGKYGEPGYKHCDHRYCDTFKWAVDRAKHYAEKLGIPWEEILNSWESERDYWYMNYYQECKQPRIEGESVRVFDTVEDMIASIRYGFLLDGVNSFGGLGKDVFVYCKDKVRGERMFMPVAWEEQ